MQLKVGRTVAQEAAMNFGLYLKNKGVISAEQLVAALEAQCNTLAPIGQLALEESMLSARDIFAILRAQCESPQLRFGELASEMGLLSHDQLLRLLMIQEERKRPLAEILIRQGILSVEQLAAEMAAFRHDRARPRRARARVASPHHRLEMARRTADPTIAV
jgi:hypothetical protein